MALTSPLKLYRHKTTGTGADKFDEICLDASNFKVTWSSQTDTIPNQLERLKIRTLGENTNTHVAFQGYMLVYDDKTDDADLRPNNAINPNSDLDLYIYSTGFSLHDAEDWVDDLHYSFPDHSGTFAMTNDIGLTLLDLRSYGVS